MGIYLHVLFKHGIHPPIFKRKDRVLPIIINIRCLHRVLLWSPYFCNYCTNVNKALSRIYYFLIIGKQLLWSEDQNWILRSLFVHLRLYFWSLWRFLTDFCWFKLLATNIYFLLFQNLLTSILLLKIYLYSGNLLMTNLYIPIYTIFMQNLKPTATLALQPQLSLQEHCQDSRNRKPVSVCIQLKIKLLLFTRL